MEGVVKMKEHIKVREVVGKGLAIFARTDTHRGTRILTESLLLRVTAFLNNVDV